LPLKFLSDSAESYLAATVYLLQHWWPHEQHQSYVKCLT